MTTKQSNRYYGYYQNFFEGVWAEFRFSFNSWRHLVFDNRKKQELQRFLAIVQIPWQPKLARYESKNLSRRTDFFWTALGSQNFRHSRLDRLEGILASFLDDHCTLITESPETEPTKDCGTFHPYVFDEMIDYFILHGYLTEVSNDHYVWDKDSSGRMF